LIGTIVGSESTVIAEAVSLSGVDWIFFDLEHSASTLESVQRQIQAVGDRAATLIRVESPTTIAVARALDAGCSGIIVPQVNSVAIAEAVVAAGKYAPLGRRSVGMARAHGYGARFASYLASANSDTAIIVQIESVSAVEAIDEIAALPGVDGLFIGPYDLSSSMGIVGQVQHPDLLAAIQKVRGAARRRRLPVGLFVGTAAAARAVRDEFEMLLVGSDTGRLMQSLKETIETIRSDEVARPSV
jgi:2-keto-3-deoxy-L-rhamnonate aldolase RhmA